MLSSVMAAEMVVLSTGGGVYVNSYCAVSMQELSEDETSVGEGSGAKLVLLEGSIDTVTLLSGST